MGQIPPHIFIEFDSCGFAPPVTSEKRAVMELLALIEQHEVVLHVPETVAEEMERHSGARKIVSGCIVSYDTSNIKTDSELFLRVKKILFGIKHAGNVNDVRILLAAKQDLCTYFVTYDKRHILNKREEIKRELGFQVVMPSECLQRLQEYLT